MELDCQSSSIGLGSGRSKNFHRTPSAFGVSIWLVEAGISSRDCTWNCFVDTALTRNFESRLDLIKRGEKSGIIQF